MRQIFVALALATASLSCVLAPSAYAQQISEAVQNQIRVKYINATRAYEAGNYTEALTRLEEIEGLSGGSRIPTAQGLKVKTLVGLGRWEAAREELAILFSSSPSDSVLSDVAPFAGQIDEHFAEQARIAAAEREREDAAWANAQFSDSEVSYTQYLESYPEGRYNSAAQNRITELEDAAWANAQGVDSVASYAQYLDRYPEGRYSSAAQSRSSELREAGFPNLRPGDTFRDFLSSGGEGPQMVVMPVGSFTMGSSSSEEERDSDEGPQRTVQISYRFAVGKYEVTWAEWDACIADGECDNRARMGRGRAMEESWTRSDRPVIYADWDSAQAYVQWLSRKTGETYRLLSEAEWEYAARAGTTTSFSFGSTISLSQANYFTGLEYSLTGSTSKSPNKTTPVGTYPANAFGLHDMHGNVEEWVEDCYVDNYTGAPTDGSARSLSNCSHRVSRSGSWANGLETARSASRGRTTAVHRGYNIGFRVAREM